MGGNPARWLRKVSNPIQEGREYSIMRKHYVVPLEKKDRAKCRQWQLRVDSGKKTPAGAISWKTRKVTGKTWSQANDECDQWAADLDEGREVIPDRRWTFLQYREHWLECCEAEGSVSPGTVKARKIEIRAAGYHLDPYLLLDIDTAMINAMTNALRRGESPSGRKLSGTYTRRVVGAVSLMMDHARRAGCIPTNPALDAFVPKDDTPEKRPVTMRDLAEVEATLDPADWHGRAVLLLAETGMRQCEVLKPDPMLWGAWDEKAGLLRVKDSKNENGLRLVPVNETLRKVLALGKFHVQLALGEDDVSGYPILCDDTGKCCSYLALYHWWCARRDAFGLSGVGLHQLRHSMVTDLLAIGRSLKEVQDIIGDKSGNVVLGVYAHSSMEQRSDAMRELDERRRVQDLYKKDGS